MEKDRRPTVKDLTLRPLEQLRTERAQLPTDNNLAIDTMKPYK